MTQLLLDLESPTAPTFDNFVVGTNVEALAAVRGLVAATDTSVRSLYLWGEAGSGRSHLLRAACAERDGLYLDGPDAAAIAAAVDHRSRFVAFDDVERLDATAQEALFHAINALREDPAAAWIASGGAQPRALALAAGRDDLRSRLAWGLVYRVERLADDEKDAALARHADARGFPLQPDVRRYLLTHCSRDLGSLMRTVDALDRRAREEQRLVTVPLIREYLQPRLQTRPATAGHVATE